MEEVVELIPKQAHHSTYTEMAPEAGRNNVEANIAVWPQFSVFQQELARLNELAGESNPEQLSRSPRASDWQVVGIVPTNPERERARQPPKERFPVGGVLSHSLGRQDGVRAA